MVDLDARLRAPAAALLVVAPHPDDEVLAAGGLLGRALACGARVRVLLLTDGDNNPWPQRWLERRLRIDAPARQRWGARRRREALAALATLGVSADHVVHLGWPDLGITDRLADDTSAAVRALATIVDDFAPTMLVLPSLGDSHPDHSACHVLVQLALARLRGNPRPLLLTYLVHGRAGSGDAVDLRLGADELRRKRDAVLMYRTQTSLSRGRLLAMVAAIERFRLDAAPTDAEPRAMPPAPRLPSRLLVVAGEQVWRQRCPQRVTPSSMLASLLDAAPQPVAAHAPVYVKRYAPLRSPWIFDHWGWRCLRYLTAANASATVDAPDSS